MVLIEDEEEDFSLKLYNVKVSVFWPSGDKEKSLSFETLKTIAETEES